MDLMADGTMILSLTVLFDLHNYTNCFARCISKSDGTTFMSL